MSEPPPTKRARCNDDANDSPESNNIAAVISPLIMASAELFRNTYEEATPYKHGLIESFCVNGFLEHVLDELKHHSKVKFKESDLFRVYQSIDLGNLTDESPLAAQIPSLMKLKKSLYSQEFRSFVESISNLEPDTLTDQVDCAANCHTRGCHLLCHDDVIGNRKVSYIIYLTDPDYDWCEKDGGRLELYESIIEEDAISTHKDDNNNHHHSATDGDCRGGRRRVPKPVPSKTILPVFNSLAYFVVSPGESFHSVQEVFSDRPRLSIQGWYHTKDPPSKMEDATLNRLKSTGKGEDTEGPFCPMRMSKKEDEKTAVEDSDSCSISTEQPHMKDTNNCDGDGDNNGSATTTTSSSLLSESDRLSLAPFINATYLKEEAMEEIRTRFEEDSSVQLRHFLKADIANKIKRASEVVDRRDKVGMGNPSLDYNIGAGSDWKAVGPAHKQRFLEYVGGGANPTAQKKGDKQEEEDIGAVLKYVQTELFQSLPFGNFLKTLSSLGAPTGHRGRIRRFRPGLDYTVAHYGILTTASVLDATLCFVAGNGRAPSHSDEVEGGDNEEDDILWASGDVGAFECYIAAEEDENGENDEADDEYNDENDSELLSVSACDNTLSLVYRDPGTMRFVKYVGSGAPSSRWDLCMEYEVPDDDDDEDEDEDNNNRGDISDESSNKEETTKRSET